MKKNKGIRIFVKDDAGTAIAFPQSLIGTLAHIPPKIHRQDWSSPPIGRHKVKRIGVER